MAKGTRDRPKRATGEQPTDEPGVARVWGEVKTTIRLQEYEGVSIALGESHDCTDTRKAKRKAKRAIIDDCEELVARKANQVRAIFEQMQAEDG